MKRWPIIAAAVATVVLIARADDMERNLAQVGNLSAPVAFLGGLALFAVVIAGLAGIRAHRARREANRAAALLRTLRPDRPAEVLFPPDQGRKPAAPVARASAAAAPTQDVDLLLQPIVSQSRNEAAGFEAVFVDAAADMDPIRRDSARVKSVAQAMALRPGDLNAACPVFVPVSAAFLLDPQSPDFVRALVRGKSNVAQGLKLIAPKDRRLAAPGLLKRWPVRFALSNGVDLLSPHASHFRISAAQLLSPHAAQRLPAWQAVEWARDHRLAVIACDAGADDDVARLIEMGIDLVTGSGRFAPLRLRRIESGDAVTHAGTRSGRARSQRAAR